MFLLWLIPWIAFFSTLLFIYLREPLTSDCELLAIGVAFAVLWILSRIFLSVRYVSATKVSVAAIVELIVFFVVAFVIVLATAIGHMPAQR